MLINLVNVELGKMKWFNNGKNLELAVGLNGLLQRIAIRQSPEFDVSKLSWVGYGSLGQVWDREENS